VAGGPELGGAGADVRGDQVRRSEFELCYQQVEELGHGVGREQVGPALRVPETGEVDRDQPGGGCQRGPDAPEREQAFWLRAGQQDVRPVAGLRLGVPSRTLAAGYRKDAAFSPDRPTERSVASGSASSRSGVTSLASAAIRRRADLDELGGQGDLGDAGQCPRHRADRLGLVSGALEGLLINTPARGSQ